MKTTEELAEYIVEEIEKEDIILAIKKYGTFKMKKKFKKLLKWWNNL